MAKAKAKKKTLRTIACKNLIQLNTTSNSGNPLCHCDTRDFNMSPFNFVCQVCDFYTPNSQGLTVDQMYTIDGKEVKINWDEIALEDDDDSDLDIDEEDEDLDVEADEFDEDLLIDKKKFKKEKVEEEIEEDDDEDEEDEEDEASTFDEDEEGLIIGHEKEKENEEDLITYEDEREEGLGKKTSAVSIDDDEELESELEELEEELGFEEDLDDEEDDDDYDEGEPSVGTPVRKTTRKKSAAKPKAKSASSGGLNFQTDVLDKVKTIEKKGEERQVCPFCGKDFKTITRHVTKCKRAPAGIEEAYDAYKKSH